MWRAIRPPHRSPNGSCASFLLCETASRLSLGQDPRGFFVPLSKIRFTEFSLRSRAALGAPAPTVHACARRRVYGERRTRRTPIWTRGQRERAGARLG